MIYLSLLELDTALPEVRSLLSEPYRLHQRLLNAWPDGAAGRMLYRLEWSRDTPRVLVQSPIEADWERCFPGGRGLAATRQKGVRLALKPGQALRFRLRANPTVKRAGKRHGLFRPEEQEAWLQRKLEEAGARLISVEPQPAGNMAAHKRQAEGPEASTRQRMTFYSVLFEGVLLVSDAERLLAAVEQGIGSAKGFGFGLLSLAPAS